MTTPPNSSPKLKQLVIDHLRSILATAVVVLVIGGVVIGVRCAGWNGPVDPGSWIEHFVDNIRTRRKTVNVEFRDAEGKSMTLGALINATLHNGRNGVYQLKDGIFPECDGDAIKAGSLVTVNIQHDVTQEILTVQIDLEKQVLFVQSDFTKEAVIKSINKKPSLRKR